MPTGQVDHTFVPMSIHRSISSPPRHSWALLLLGVVTVGCQAPTTSTPAAGPAGALTEVVVLERIVDGDTVVLTDGRTVRITGIDTPETKHPEIGVECYGPEATRYAEDVLAGAEIRLEPDGGSDRYGRTLGHLWYRAPDDWVNYGLAAVTAGYADLYRAADHQHRATFEAAQRDARGARRGMWAACG
jgi:micrococcal nuclease